MAVGALGVATNRPFGIFLLIVAAAIFYCAQRDDRVNQWWWRAGRRARFLAGFGIIAVAGVGWYLMTHYAEPPSTTDVEARQQIADLRTKVAALTAQVETAMKFGEAEKAAREQAEGERAAGRAKRETARQVLAKFLDSGKRLDLEIRQRRLAPLDRVNAWIGELEGELKRALDESYVTRSRNGAGITPTLRGWDTPPPPELSRALAQLDIRLARVSEFMTELAD